MFSDNTKNTFSFHGLPLREGTRVWEFENMVSFSLLPGSQVEYEEERPHHRPQRAQVVAQGPSCRGGLTLSMWQVESAVKERTRDGRILHLCLPFWKKTSHQVELLSPAASLLDTAPGRFLFCGPRADGILALETESLAQTAVTYPFFQQ